MDELPRGAAGQVELEDGQHTFGDSLAGEQDRPAVPGPIGFVQRLGPRDMDRMIAGSIGPQQPNLAVAGIRTRPTGRIGDPAGVVSRLEHGGRHRRTRARRRSDQDGRTAAALDQQPERDEEDGRGREERERPTRRTTTTDPPTVQDQGRRHLDRDRVRFGVQGVAQEALEPEVVELTHD